jgi:hypothetical protein
MVAIILLNGSGCVCIKLTAAFTSVGFQRLRNKKENIISIAGMVNKNFMRVG